MTISGQSLAGGRFETGVAIFDAHRIRLQDTRIQDLFTGVRAEHASEIDIVGNHIPNPGDGIVGRDLSGSIRIESNEIDSGGVNLEALREGSLRISGNRIAEDCEWEGTVMATDNQIFSRVDLNASGGWPSVFSGNFVRGPLRLSGQSPITVVGNYFGMDNNLPPIEDLHGDATIVGNYLSSNEEPIFLKPGSQSTVFANHYSGVESEGAVQRLMTKHGIELTSTEEFVVLKAGGSSILIDSSGQIRIESAGDVAIQPTGRFSVKATEISLEATGTTTLKGGLNVDLESGVNMNLKAGAVMDLEAILINVN
jgi:hypothetical protein